jgi:hypothetical protein
MARQLAALGHDVRLIPAQYVKPFLKGHKNDYRDAEAIAEAVQRPTMHFVAIKTPEQMGLLALHCVRSRRVSLRTGVINQIRGSLIERGISVRQGVVPLRKALPDVLSSNTQVLSPRMVNLIAELVQDWHRLDERVAAVSAEIESLAEQDEGCQRVMTVPGVGPIISSAVVAAIGNGAGFTQGRDFGAWLGSYRSRSQLGIARSWARSPSAATSICGHCSCRPRTSCWRGGQMPRCGACGLGSNKHRSGSTATCWRLRSPTSSPALPGRFSPAVAVISRGSSPMPRDPGSLRFTKGMASRDRSDTKHLNGDLATFESFPTEVCEME